ncbi:MAG TPA: divergent polysaccharide deacetylase family protein [Proteobacteria bacterium]|nr:divergent polysaccharide deacetylase family protein [Pseudomonadota bacterium]
MKTGLLYFEAALPRTLEPSNLVGRLRTAVSAAGSPLLDLKVYEQDSKTLVADLYYRKRLAAQLVFVRPYLEEAAAASVWEEPRQPPPGEGYKPPASPSVAIIIDDIGQKRLDFSFLNLPYDLTFSILPFTPYGAEFARRARARGREIMVHIPMEPVDYPRINPGKGALTTIMSDYELVRQLEEDLAQIALAVGANNHMGSRLTQDEDAMRVVLSDLKKRGLFFVDSRTIASTVALKVAKEIGLPCIGRDLFLDHIIDEELIRQNIAKAGSIAKKRGYAVAIGHPHLATLNALKAELPKLKSQGIKVVPVSRLVR